MARLSLLIDLQRCVGCMSCVVACKMENDVPVGVSWNNVETVGPVGQYPDTVRQYYLPHGCMHCMNPACVPVCPVGAIWRDAETGLVPLDAEACIGCGACVTACPYAARTMDPISNLPVKCTLCTQLLDEGKLPSCVKHCIAQARFYGDLDDPDSDSARYLAEPGSSRELHLMESQGTGPSVAYLEPAVGMLSADVPLTLTQGL